MHGKPKTQQSGDHLLGGALSRAACYGYERTSPLAAYAPSQMLERLQRTPYGKENGREPWRRLVKKSLLHHRPSRSTLDGLSNELMSVESRPAHREEELPRAD
jgi:hypothetical protein